MITNCSFSLQVLHESAQKLGIHFENDKKTISTKEFYFTSKGHAELGNLLDIASLNGSCQENAPAKIFSLQDVRATSKILKKFNSADGQTVCVLDLKNTDEGYLNLHIQESEQEVINFLKNNNPQTLCKHAKKMHALFKSIQLDYLIMEGSLKVGLLEKGLFSDKEISFLNKSTANFCQFAEFFMNGFKLGYENESFQASHYIAPLQETPFRPYKCSTVFYPPNYASIYSASSPFFNTLSQGFVVNVACDSNKITTAKITPFAEKENLS